MIELDVLITGAVGIVSSIVSAWTSWFFTRKKYNTDIDSQLIQNMQESLEFYKNLSDDNKKRLDEVLRRNEELEKRDEKLEEEVRQLKNQMINLMGQICLDLSCKIRQKEIFGNK
jgi:flagellar basal body-associated protein FliL